MKRLLVTGSSGLIGSEVCMYFANAGWQINGVDNNQRAVFFGAQGDTRWNQQRLTTSINDYRHHELDIRNREGVIELISNIQPDAVVHAAAQPSHDKAASIPFEDFDTNASGTLNLLEAVRRYNTSVPFIHMSTNKVYGDAPNRIRMKESATRWELDESEYINGIPETFTIDQSKHSLFGASKLAADIMVQEYGRYFAMPTCIIRGGCLTGPNHSGVELHGFLSYLIRCNLEKKEYTVYGYKGKQVRDNIHSFDVASFIHAFIDAPGIAEVYNLGGGFQNTCSILEAFERIEKISSIPMLYRYVEENRIGDHICYYSDLTKIHRHYPRWKLTRNLDDIFNEIYNSWKAKQTVNA